MRLRNRRTADQPVDTDGTARCSRCGSAVPVRPDGTCDLGHRVTSAEQALLAMPDPAPASPPAPESAGGLEPTSTPPLEATVPSPEAKGPPPEPAGPPAEAEVSARRAISPPPEAAGPPPEAAVPAREATSPPPEPTTDDLIADAFGENTFARPHPAPAAQQHDRNRDPHPAPAAQQHDRNRDGDPGPAHQAHDKYDLNGDLGRAGQERDRYDLDAGSWDSESESPPAVGGSLSDAEPPVDRPAEPDSGGSDGSANRPSSSKNTALALEELLDFGADLPPSALDNPRRAS